VSDHTETEGLCVAHLIANAATVASVAALQSALAQHTQQPAATRPVGATTSNDAAGRTT
jgi:hypothetical protein